MPSIRADDSSSEHYLVLTVITEEAELNRTANCLEGAGIPVLVEHIEIIEGSLRADGYRLMIPSHFLQTATRIVEALSGHQIGRMEY